MLNLDICKISCHLLHRNCVSRTCPITLRTHLVNLDDDSTDSSILSGLETRSLGLNTLGTT